MVSQYDVIVVSLDARGSGYRGDGIAHMLYKKIGKKYINIHLTCSLRYEITSSISKIQLHVKPIADDDVLTRSA